RMSPPDINVCLAISTEAGWSNCLLPIRSQPFTCKEPVAPDITSGAGYSGDLPLVIAFVILAAFTYSSGLRAPASIAIVKDILIYVTALAAVFVVPLQLGGFGKIFSAVPASKLLLAPPPANSTGAYGIYATLPLGSALALFLYPHSLTGILSASSGHA